MTNNNFKCQKALESIQQCSFWPPLFSRAS